MISAFGKYIQGDFLTGPRGGQSGHFFKSVTYWPTANSGEAQLKKSPCISQEPGFDRVSDFAISFHYVSGDMM